MAGVWVASPFFSLLGRDGRASASEGKGVGLGEGEGEDLFGRTYSPLAALNPSPQSSPLYQRGEADQLPILRLPGQQIFPDLKLRLDRALV